VTGERRRRRVQAQCRVRQVADVPGMAAAEEEAPEFNAFELVVGRIGREGEHPSPFPGQPIWGSAFLIHYTELGARK
jgi:hypothetical protein